MAESQNKKFERNLGKVDDARNDRVRKAVELRKNAQNQRLTDNRMKDTRMNFLDDPNEFNFTVSSITTGIGYSSLAAMHSQPPLTVTVNNGSHSELIPTQGIVTGDDNYDLGLTEIILPSNVSVITANILNYALLDELTLFIKKYLLTVNVILTDLEIVELLNHIPTIFSDSLLKDLLANFDSLIKDFDKIKPEWASSTAEGRKLLNDHMDHINFTPRNIIGDGNIPNKCILKRFSTFQQNEYPDDICLHRLQALTTALPGMFPDPKLIY